jgi:hypothetical protein
MSSTQILDNSNQKNSQDETNAPEFRSDSKS